MARSGTGRLARALKAVAVLVGVVFALTACRTDVVLDLVVSDDGSGTAALTVELDDEAAAALGDLDGGLRLNDLEASGWQIDGPDSTAAGGLRLVLRREVAGPDQWQAALDSIAGPGVFDGVEVVRDSRFAARSQRLSFVLDLSQGWSLLADDSVTAALGGEPFGAPIDELTGGRPIDDLVSVDLRASVAADDGEAPSTTAFAPRFDDPEPLRVGVTSTVERAAPVLLRWIAIALGALAVLAAALATTGVVLQRRADRLRPPTPAKLAERVPGGPAPVGHEINERSGGVRLVVIEPLTVLYDQRPAPETHVLPFVRANGGTARADTVLGAYDQLLSGAMSTAKFWELCGVEGDPGLVDEAYVAQRRLRAGADDFLREMQRRRIPVAAATNDAAAWSQLTRERDRLSGIWPWLVSAEVGARKPDLGIFEILRRESGIAFGHCLYVDMSLASLDGAESLGMKTALFDTGDLDLPEVVAHPVIHDLKGLFGKR